MKEGSKWTVLLWLCIYLQVPPEKDEDGSSLLFSALKLLFWSSNSWALPLVLPVNWDSFFCNVLHNIRQMVTSKGNFWFFHQALLGSICCILLGLQSHHAISSPMVINRHADSMLLTCEMKKTSVVALYLDWSISMSRCPWLPISVWYFCLIWNKHSRVCEVGKFSLRCIYGVYFFRILKNVTIAENIWLHYKWIWTDNEANKW